MKTKLIFILMMVTGMYTIKVQACNELNTTYNAVTRTVIQSSDACLTTTAIDGSNSSANRIPTGTLVFYRTNQGRYGKMEILEYGHSLRVRCTTYNDNGTIFRANENLTVRGTWSCDLDIASEAQAGADFFWNQRTSVLRSLDPIGGARFWVAKSGGTNNAAINLTGFYRADNGSCGQAYIRQIGNQVYWFGEHPDGSFAHIFRGTISGNTLTGNLWDVPKGTLLNRGTCVYNIAPNGTLNRTGGTIGCNQLVRATLPTSLPASRPMQPGSGALTGVWDCNDGAATYVREDGANFLFFSEARNNGTRPGFSNLYVGRRSGNTITGTWVDVPKGTLLGNGTMTLRVESDTRFVRTDAGSGYGGSVWTRTSGQSGAQTRTITPNPIGILCPTRLVRGDAELGGGNFGGPRIQCNVSLRVSADNAHLEAIIYYKVEEEVGDNSTVEQTFTQRIWTAPANQRITNINSARSSSASQRGPMAGPEIFGCNDGEIVNMRLTGGLLRSLQVIGDTGGSDISNDNDCGCDTQIRRIEFNPITLTLTQR
ncbi:hypothetical protein [Haliscomenobacter sp.]|uniref:hypothetical protein n=1 Tax=Haliscomenobacter sp. TaxID=2717303 RepID=UPI003593DC08